ncbi:uncharacterized protein LOC128620030 [Ictalurus furcatus]|uniref:uncharacterized protein LOC128620030 n=1 Tax=Ictalurus furcatus TaxID=66913 RepID=UPI00234FDC55|nr:uncharacterized protein LOC128620030 [Ictalurus furcatus]
MMENGCPRGTGFVSFSSPGEARKAILEMNGRLLGSRPVFVTPAQSKEEHVHTRLNTISSHSLQMQLQSVGEKSSRTRTQAERKPHRSPWMHRVMGNPGGYPREHRAQVGYTVDRVPIHRRAQSHTHSHTTDVPISLPADWTGGGNRSTRRKPPQQGRTCKLRTHRATAGIEPLTL